MYSRISSAWFFLFVLLVGTTFNPAQGSPVQSRETIRSTARAFLVRQVSAQFSGQNHIHVGHLDPRLRLPACGAPLKAFLPPGGHFSGNTTVGVRCPATAGWTIYLSARISLFGKILEATRPLAAGERVKRTDLKLVERNLAQLPYGYITHPSDAEGKLATRMISAGSVLTPAMLTAPRIIHRGDRVMLVASAAGLRVQMAGKAMGSGATGDKIRVEALSSKRIVQGVVISSGVVKVTL